MNKKNSANPLSKLFSGIASFFTVIFSILYAILEGISRATSNNNLGNTNNYNTSSSQQLAGHYQCLCGNIQHGSRWGRNAKLSTMWKANDLAKVMQIYTMSSFAVNKCFTLHQRVHAQTHVFKVSVCKGFQRARFVASGRPGPL